LSSKLAQFGKLRHSESQAASTPVERTLVCDNRKQLIEVSSFMKKFSHLDSVNQHDRRIDSA
jgi:hypothetical protein